MWNLTREEQMVVFFLIAAFLVAIGVKLRGGISYPRISPSSLLIKVKISGAVRNPGWYNLPEGSILIEAIKKAGGALPRADLERLNLSSSLKEEEEIWVPGEKININLASPEQLIYLPGIGPVLARRIFEFRQERGGFQTLGELKEVRGIGERCFEKIRDRITLGNDQ